MDRTVGRESEGNVAEKWKCSTPKCAFSHHILNQLTTIIGNCDILVGRAQELPADPECVKRLAAIRDTAIKLAEELNSHVRALDAESKRRTVSLAVEDMTRERN